MSAFARNATWQLFEIGLAIPLLIALIHADSFAIIDFPLISSVVKLMRAYALLLARKLQKIQSTVPSEEGTPAGRDAFTKVDSLLEAIVFRSVCTGTWLL